MKKPPKGQFDMAAAFSHHPRGQAGDPGFQMNNPANMTTRQEVYDASIPYGDGRRPVVLDGPQIVERPQQRVVFGLKGNTPGHPDLQLTPEMASMGDGPQPNLLAMGGTVQPEARPGDRMAGIKRGMSMDLGSRQAQMGKRGLA
jgi:hypothetical protein